MTTLTLIYAADRDGNFTHPATGKCWDVDRAWFRETIKGASIICGRKTFEQDWKGLVGACQITVLTHDNSKVWEVKEGIERLSGRRMSVEPVNSVGLALHISRGIWRGDSEKLAKKEVFCVGGKKTIEALAPFASRLMLSHIDNEGARDYWLPEFIKHEKRDDYKNHIWHTAAPAKWRGDSVFYEFRRARPIEF